VITFKSYRTAEKTSHLWDPLIIKYSSEHRKLLKQLRNEALKIVQVLQNKNIIGFVHGSVARGDVDDCSDIDIIIFHSIPPQSIELALDLNGYSIYDKKIIQATPCHTPKGHIYLDPYEKISVTFPLLEFRSLEYDFYRFGGLANEKILRHNIRVPGCCKRMTLIEPTSIGHIESNIIGREREISELLKVNIEIVRERMRVLSRRDRIGRTGIFLNITIRENDSFEKVFKRLRETNPALRRTYIKRERN
jgi:hypothetical protein